MLKLLLLFITTLPLYGDSLELKLSGPGLAQYASGRIYQCSEIFLDITIREDALTLHQGGYICGHLQASFDPFQMEIHHGKLMYQGQELGSISKEELRYEIYDPNDNSTYFFSLKKEANGLRYFEEWHDGEKIALKINGLLFPLSLHRNSKL